MEAFEILICLFEFFVSVVCSKPSHLVVASIGTTFYFFCNVCSGASFAKELVVFPMVEVSYRVCSILIAVWAVADFLFLGTLLAQIGKLSIFGGHFPFVHLVDKLLIAINTGAFHELSAIFAFGWLFKAHHLVEIGIETE